MMAGKASWLLPSPFIAKVIHRAAVDSLKHFCHARQVCRSWRDAGSGAEFDRNLLEECLDVSEVEKTGCFFDEYADDWYCYWDESYGVPEDLETNYAFKPLPVGTRAGFMTIPNADILGGGSPLLTLKAIKTLLNVGEGLARVGASPGMGSEGDSDLTPIVLPWDSGQKLTPNNVLALMGANPTLREGKGLFQMDFSSKREKLTLGVTFQDYLSDDDDDEEDGDITEDDKNVEEQSEGGKVCKRFREFMFAEGDPLVFYAGSDLMNPVPMFYLRKLTDRLVGGFVTSLIHT